MNPQVEEARQVALSILKPSQTELEHGLDLHRHSLVIESYALGLRSLIDGDALARLVMEGASDLEFREAYGDMLLSGMATDAAMRQEYQQAFDYAGVDCLFQCAGEECQSPLQLIKRLASCTYAVDMLGDIVHRATRPDDIVRAYEQGKHSCYMTMNGVPLAQEWKTVEEEMRFIRMFFQLGVRMMHLTYNRRNMLADGCQEESDAGLSDFGASAIKEMNRVGVIVDVAHTGWQSCIEAAAASDKPIVASHTGAFALNAHKRCKSDEAIRAIVDSGGTIGICCVPRFLGRSGDINAFLDHVDYLAKKFGVDAITIGTDQHYTPPGIAEQELKIPALRKLRPRFEKLWRNHEAANADPRWNDERMLKSLAWTNWPLLTVGLVKRGYSDTDIQKIIGGNILRVARAAFPSPCPLQRHLGLSVHEPGHLPSAKAMTFAPDGLASQG